MLYTYTDQSDFDGDLEINILASGTLDVFCELFDIVDDNLLEPNEILIFNITGFSEKSDLFTVVENSTHEVTIFDNEGMLITQHHSCVLS